jgi:Mn2+/Fe2+ NRAMP family transporter
MQLYVQSEVVEKGLGPEQLNAERAEVAAGSIFANLIAMFIIVATGATLFAHGDDTVNNAAEAAKALAPFAGRYAEVLFAVDYSVRAYWRPRSCRSPPPT